MGISSLKNPRVKRVVKLRDRRDRDREGRFLIEGYRELLRALENGFPLEEVYFAPDYFHGGNERALLERIAANGTELVETSADVLRKMAYRDRPEGLIGVAPQRRLELQNIALPDDRPALVVVAEAIEKPGNLGTMLRSADATGVDALILADACTDLFNPNVVRASTGMLFSVPVAEATTPDTLAWLREHRITVLAATPHTDTVYTDADLTVPLALAVGTEQYGLSETWLKEADLNVRIPMLGQADSLNVATATTLLLYEAVRQRKTP